VKAPRGVGRTAAEFKAEYNPAQEVEHLRSLVAELEGKVKRERDMTGEQRIINLALTEAIREAAPRPMAYKPNKRAGTPITHVLQLTDLHNGEVTKKDEVDGFGEFSPEIFTSRIQKLASAVIDVTNVKRAGYNIPHLHILGTGDYISGDIHEELKVTNAYPAPVQAVRAGYDIGEAIAMMAPHFERVTCDFITLDNHGRMTRKNQAAEGGENNWGYVVAHVVKQYLQRFSNVDMRIHAKASALVSVGDVERYLLFHGHQIKGWAGLPYYGFDRRVAMEAVKRMGAPESGFTKMVMGHFHVAVDAPNWLIGGSLSGTNAFDHSCGRHSRAHQTSWLVHQKHGQFDWTRWWL
jgi:hypothetical protein